MLHKWHRQSDAMRCDAHWHRGKRIERGWGRYRVHDQDTTDKFIVMHHRPSGSTLLHIKFESPLFREMNLFDYVISCRVDVFESRERRCRKYAPELYICRRGKAARSKSSRWRKSKAIIKVNGGRAPLNVYGDRKIGLNTYFIIYFIYHRSRRFRWQTETRGFEGYTECVCVCIRKISKVSAGTLEFRKAELNGRTEKTNKLWDIRALRDSFLHNRKD